MTSIKWNMGNSLLGAAAFVIAIVALSRTVNSQVLPPATSTDLVLRSQATDLNLYDEELSKRWVWAVIGWVFGLANFGALLYGLADSCKDFSKSTGDKFSCLYGALGTAVTIAGAGWAGWNKYLEIGTALLNASKRDVLLVERDSLVSDLEDMFSELTGLSSQFIGHQLITREILEDNTTASLYLPTLLVTTPHNTSFHFSIERRTNNSFTSVLGMTGNITDFGKREDFNEENFSKGGLEFTHYYVAKQDHDNGKLSQSNDWHLVYDQTKCKARKEIRGSHKNRQKDYVKYQVYDNNNEGTIAAGTIVGFTNKPAGFHGLKLEPSGLPVDSSCEIN